MNYEATIRQLKERRDFYAAAATALEKIQQHENGTKATAVLAIRGEAPKRKSTRAHREAGKARAERHWANVDWAAVERTMTLTAREAAQELGVSYQTVLNRRGALKKRTHGANGNAGEPISVQ